MELRCENSLCLYWDHQHCRLDAVELNVCGACDSCIQIQFPERTLAQLRRGQLARLLGNDDQEPSSVAANNPSAGAEKERFSAP